MSYVNETTRVRHKGDGGSRRDGFVPDICVRGNGGEVQRPGLVEANPKYRKRSVARSLLFKPAITRALRDFFTVYIRIDYKSLYRYNVGLEGRENVKEDDNGNQHERKENNASCDLLVGISQSRSGATRDIERW